MLRARAGVRVSLPDARHAVFNLDSHEVIMTSSHQFSTLSALFNDAASLEKILKLAQAVSQIIAGLNQGVEEVKRWNAVRGQIALCRLRPFSRAFHRPR